MFLAMTGARAMAEPAPPGQKTGLALSAGAAAGLAHVGVLQALEAEHARIDAIAGTSMGAVIGALYASGYRAPDIEQILEAVDWRRIFSRDPERSLVPLAQRVDHEPAIARVGLESGSIELPQAIDSDYRINRLLIKLLTRPGIAARGDFDSLAIPFRAVAADLRTGERVVLSRGSLARAVRASMSIPVVLPPLEDGDRLLVDGGIVDPLPVGVARAMGSDFVIGVDARLPPIPPETYRNAVGMAAKVIDILARARSVAFMEPADLTIKPDVSGTAAMDYQDFAQTVARGREAATPVLAANRQHLRPAPAPDSTARVSTPIIIAELAVEGNHSVREELIRKTFGVHPSAQPVDLEQVLRGMDALHATRLFDSIWVDFASISGDRTQAKIQVQETWPWALEGGISYVESDQIGGFVRVRNRNLWGFGENLAITALASDAELRGSIQLASNRLFTPAIGYYARTWLWEDKPRIFVDHDPAGRVDFDRLGAAAGIQRALGPEVLLRAGVGIERIETDAHDDPMIQSGRQRILDVSGLAAWDRLDDRSFPSDGFSVGVSGTWGAIDDLEQDATGDYWRIAASARGARSLGRRTVLDGVALAGVANGDVPLHELFRVGGPIVPGLYRDELWDRQGAALGIACRFQIWKGVRLTARGGVGNAWQDWDGATFRSLHRGIGLGLESPTRVGPVSLMWGRGDDGESRIYFTAGYRLYPALWLQD